ncbi:MAG: TIGR02757 family protein [Bacteroidales bacterium]|jgi:uncharacterized protein (TIGR02757 family)|nr:TIGR02757 family protein [Bacteroidales bacterium]
MEVDKAIAEMLRGYADKYETRDFIVGDPSWYMHQVEGNLNRESMAFLASVFSFGSREQFMPKIASLLEWSRGDIDNWLRSGEFRQRFRPDDTHCFYRLYTYGSTARFLEAYSRLLNSHGSLGEYVHANASAGIEAVASICKYFGDCGAGAIVPKDTTSSCKRVCMFMRWMVRDNSPVDLGLWSSFIDKRTLIMPMDTHVVTQSVRLGLLTSRTASMSAARRLTMAMSTVFPDDPLKGDFALFGYGVNNKNK